MTDVKPSDSNNNPAIKPAVPTALVATTAPVINAPVVKPAAVETAPKTVLATDAKPAVSEVAKPSGATVAPPVNYKPGETATINRRLSDDKYSEANQTKKDFLEALGATVVGDGNGPSKETADIYVMPKEFQHHNRVTGGSGGGMAVMAGGILMLILSGFAAYAYFINPKLLNDWFGIDLGGQTAETAPVQTVAETPAPVVPVQAPTSSQALPGELLKDIFIKYSQSLSRVVTFQDYFNLVNLYGSATMKRQAESDKLLADADNEYAASKLVAAKQATPALVGTEEIADTTDASSATLNIKLPDGVSDGQVKFVLEDGQWKIDSQTWSLVGAARPRAVDFKPAEDRDQDNLTDAEEDLLGSGKDSVDSDADGYSDGEEIVNLYNPAGKNKLIDNPALTTYSKTELGVYTMVYTNKWTISFKEESAGGIITFTGPGNQAFSLVVMNNAKRESIDTYYERLTGETAIDPSQRRQTDDWSGIMTKDSMTVYLTDNQKTRFFSLTYLPGDDNTLLYPHLFEAVVKSLVIK